MTARRMWLTLHLYIGLLAGLLFVTIGLTGSLLVFYQAIDERLNPELLLTRNSGERRPLAEVIAAAETAHPDLGAADRVKAPRLDGRVWSVWFRTESESARSDWTVVTVDPFTAEVLSRRVWGRDPATFIYKLHYTLTLGESGATIVGAAGLLLMLSVGSGLCLWWPILVKGGVRLAFGVRGTAVNYDLHKLVGTVAAPLLLVLAFSGVYMTFPWMIKPIVTAFGTETKWPTGLNSVPATGARRLDADEAIRTARSVFPSAEFKRIMLPDGPDGVYQVMLRQPGEIQQTYGVTNVWLDQYSGDILEVRDGKKQRAADAFFAWQFPLHSGEAFGLPGRLAVFFGGLTPAVLYVTGLALWWRKRRSRRKRRNQHTTIFRRERPNEIGALPESELSVTTNAL